MAPELRSQETALTPLSFQIPPGSRPRKASVPSVIKLPSVPFKDLLNPSSSYYLTTSALVGITIISCQYSRIASELATHFPPLLSPHLLQTQAEFCFLPDDILSFHGLGLKVTSSVKFLLIAPAPNNRFLELHLQVLPPLPEQGAALKPVLATGPGMNHFSPRESLKWTSLFSTEAL